MFLRNHVTQWLVITRWSGTLVVSGVDWTCDTAVQCFDPLSSHRPNSLIYETRQRNQHLAHSYQSWRPQLPARKKYQPSFQSLGPIVRAPPTWSFQEHPGAPKNLPNTWLILEKRGGMWFLERTNRSCSNNGYSLAMQCALIYDLGELESPSNQPHEMKTA